MAQHFNISETVARLEREANVAAGLSDEPLETIPDFDDLPDGYETVEEATAALRTSKAAATYQGDLDGFNVRPSERCQTPSPLGIGCVSKAFHPGLHSWDKSERADDMPMGDVEEPIRTAEAAMLPGMSEPEQATVPEPDDDYGWFEISADIKAVRGKNTSNGPALEIVLDASIDGHVAEVMGLIGRGFTRVLFKPYVVQQKLPLTQEVTPPPTDEDDSEPAEAGQEHDDDDETGDD